MISSIIKALVKKIKIQPPPKKNGNESMIWLTPKSSQHILVNRIESKKNLFTEKELFKKKREWRIEQKTKRRLVNCSRYDD